MTVFELLVLAAILSGGHFLGDALATKFGVQGWFGDFALGIVISLGLFGLLVFTLKDRVAEQKTRRYTTAIEWLALTFVLAGGHFLGDALETRFGLKGWLGGSLLGAFAALGLVSFAVPIFRKNSDN